MLTHFHITTFQSSIYLRNAKKNTLNQQKIIYLQLNNGFEISRASDGKPQRVCVCLISICPLREHRPPTCRVQAKTQLFIGSLSCLGSLAHLAASCRLRMYWWPNSCWPRARAGVVTVVRREGEGEGIGLLG